MSYRLETDYIPTYYSLSYNPDIPNKKFKCREQVLFKENAKSNHLTLHADSSFKIHSVTQLNHPLDFKHSDNKLLIKGDSLSSSNIEIEFEGSLDQPNLGFYYINDELACTQFESIFARKAFVCFDEPSIKTEFDISIEIPSHLKAFSNMPVESKTERGNTTLWKFQRTPKMCTYLLAFAVGKFEVVTGFTKRKLPVDVIAVEGKSELMKYAVEEGVKAIEWYEDFTNVPFPLPRLQMLAVPAFQFLAMENYGLLIFRDTGLLGAKGVSSQSSIQLISECIWHEIAHQWAGDSTSPKWWNAIWLNEGFATILPFIALTEVHPEYDMMGSFESDYFNVALKFDSSSHTHPIHVEIEKEEEIPSIFDDISYAKSGCFIRMIYNFVGRETFKKVLEVYFTRFENGNADTSDFVSIFSEVTGEDWTDFFNAWTHQSNYPLVEVKPTEIVLHKFTNKGPNNESKWPLPLYITICENGVIREEKYMVKDRLEFHPNCDWFKVNSRNTSLCRTLYYKEAFDKLINAVKTKQLDRTDRYSILIDFEAFAYAGMISYTELLDIINHFDTENDQIVLGSLISILSSLEEQFHVYLPLIYKFEEKILSRILNSIRMEPQNNENPGISGLRDSILTKLAVFCKKQECIDYGVKLFREFQKENKVPEGSDPNLLGFTLKVGCLYTDDGYDYIGKLINETENPEYIQKSILARGFMKKELVDKQLEAALNLNAEKIKFGLLGVNYGPNSGNKVWEFFKRNADFLLEKLGDFGFAIAELIEKMTSSFSTEEEEKDVIDFFKKHPVPSAKLTVEQSIESISRRKELIKKEGSKFEEHLKVLI